MELIPSLKNFLHFRRELSKLEKLKKPTQKKILIFQERELSSTKLKKLLYFFQKKLFLYFRREIAKPENQKKSTLKKFLIFLQKQLFTIF